jgi:hypothetical protein
LQVVVVVYFAMSRIGRKLTGAFKKALEGSSRCSRGSSSMHVSEPEESPMHEDEEMEPTEEQEQEQEMEDADAPHLDLESNQEVQAYHHVKDHYFFHTPAYNPDLLTKIGMDTEFITI